VILIFYSLILYNYALNYYISYTSIAQQSGIKYYLKETDRD